MSTQELIDFDINQINKQLNGEITAKKPNEYYNKTVMNAIVKSAIKDCGTDKAKCKNAPDRSLTNQLGYAAEEIGPDNSKLNVYKQHLENILSLKYGGTPVATVGGTVEPLCSTNSSLRARVPLLLRRQSYAGRWLVHPCRR